MRQRAFRRRRGPQDRLALATVRTGESEPSPADLRAATADVIERCVYGVDLNDLAIEITKVAL